MRTAEWLKSAENTLAEADIVTSRLDALVLLEDCMGLDRALLLAHPETELSDRQFRVLSYQIERRARHEPLAYIRGKAEFYGREFIVDKHVLVPRPESETMIDVLKKLAKNISGLPKIADVGSGSACLGITAALELGVARVDFYDIDRSALAVTKLNAGRYKVGGSFYEHDLLDGSRPYDILLANLPYVPNGYIINEAARHEPKTALFAGNDGLEVYRNLFAQLSGFTWQPKFILTESLPQQHGELATMAHRCGFGCTETDDFIQVFSATG